MMSEVLVKNQEVHVALGEELSNVVGVAVKVIRFLDHVRFECCPRSLVIVVEDPWSGWIGWLWWWMDSEEVPILEGWQVLSVAVVVR